MTTTATCPYCELRHDPEFIDECEHLAFACGVSRIPCPCGHRVEPDFNEFIAPMIESIVYDGRERLRDMLCAWASSGQAPKELLDIPATIMEAVEDNACAGDLDDQDICDPDPDDQHLHYYVETHFVFVDDMAKFAEALKKSVPAMKPRVRARK